MPKIIKLSICLIVSLLVIVNGFTLQASAQSQPKAFGVVSDPWTINKWSGVIGKKPTFPMEFEAWSRNRTLETHFAQAKASGYNSYMITWEPWEPVPASLGLTAQGASQSLYTNVSIANGLHDDYINNFALSVANSGLQTVYIRYAHEMNGNWYPWSNDSTSYILAWRHIVNIFRANGATNAKFIYSTNPSLYQTDAQWTAGFWKYWPGGSYVDYVGSTMINFGSTPCAQIPCPGNSKGYSVKLFSQRLIMGYKLTGKQLVITEFNTSAETRITWLSDLNSWLASGTSWISALVISQHPSRGAQQMVTGNMSWNVMDYPDTYDIVRSIMLTSMLQ